MGNGVRYKVLLLDRLTGAPSPDPEIPPLGYEPWLLRFTTAARGLQRHMRLSPAMSVGFEIIVGG